MTIDNSDDDKTREHTSLRMGETVAHYRLERLIGSGGMGYVYLATDTKLNRQVALKFLPAHLCADATYRARFVQEAQVAARVSHPHLITIFEVAEYHERPYIVMEYLDGVTLRERMESDPPDLSEVMKLAEQIAQGLKHAHEAGIVHRDIKPTNVVIDHEGQAKILDFGLARMSGTDALTKDGSTLGTLGYMSPEQVAGQETDARSDLFSLGILLYEMITLVSPFKSESEAATLQAITQRVTEPLSRYKSGVSDELERMVSKLLEKDPALRYQTAADFIADTRKLSQSESGMFETTKPAWRTPSLVIAGIILLAALGYVGIDMFGVKDSPAAATEHDFGWVNSVAVLPFTDLSQDQDQQYFCAGMTQDIITRLARIRELKVISRNSISQYTESERDITKIAEELQVASVLDGTIQKEHNNLRITVQLIDASTGHHLWSERFNVTPNSIFEVQDQVSRAVAQALEVELLDHTEQDLSPRARYDQVAYDYYLRGMHLVYDRFAPFLDLDALASAIEMFEKAIAIDSTFAQAYTGLGSAYAHINEYKRHQGYDTLAFVAMQKAYDLEPMAWYSLGGQGWIALNDERYDDALDWYRQSEAINPNSLDVVKLTADFLRGFGLFDQALERYYKAIELSPFYVWTRGMMAGCLFKSGRLDEAQTIIESILEINPKHYTYVSRLAWIAIARKDLALADSILSAGEASFDPDGTRKSPHPSLNFARAHLYAARGERDKTFATVDSSRVVRGLQHLYALLDMKAEAIARIEERIDTVNAHGGFSMFEVGLTYPALIGNPFLENLRDDQRFQAVVARQKLVYEENLKKYGGYSQLH